jgi:diguanylate cyclase (GGDEF)-like protein/PAS domain S-box-containing protein
MIYDGQKPIDYIFLDVNDSFYKLTGLENKDIIGKSVKEVFPDIEDYWIKKYGEVASTGKRIKFENFSGALNKYFSVNVYSPKKNQFVTVFNDITEAKEIVRVIESERALLKTTLFSMSDAVITTDLNGRIELMNDVACKLTGWSEEEAVGLEFAKVFEVMHELTGLEMDCIVSRTLLDKGDLVEDEHAILISRNREKVPIEDSASPIRDSSGAIIGTVVVFRDVSEKRGRIEKISYLSYHDQLTGLYNRHFFEEELVRLDVKRNLPISLLMIDVNGLKLTNDAFGHAAGDELLKTVAKSICSACRKDEICARVGGDEFVLLLPRTDAVTAEELSERILEEININQSGHIVISVSIGSATKSAYEEDVKSVLMKAEEMMYRRKIVESQSMRSSTIQVILKALHETNKREKEHSEEVGKLAVKIGKEMGMTKIDLLELETAGLMHDIGKIALNNDVLNKPGLLTHEEFEGVKKHSETGYHILKSVDQYSELADYALYHHERWDGTGYPRGLKGEEIPLFARIIMIADAYEAMTSERPYRSTMSKEMAIDEIKKHSGTQFDPKLAELFIELFS